MARTMPDAVGATIDGRDLTSTFRNRAASPHEQLLIFHQERVAAVRTKKWKLVEEAPYLSLQPPVEAASSQAMLVDVVNDPEESYSVAERHPEIVGTLRKRLQQARASFAQAHLQRRIWKWCHLGKPRVVRSHGAGTCPRWRSFRSVHTRR